MLHMVEQIHDCPATLAEEDRNARYADEAASLCDGADLLVILAAPMVAHRAADGMRGRDRGSRGLGRLQRGLRAGMRRVYHDAQFIHARYDIMAERRQPALILLHAAIADPVAAVVGQVHHPEADALEPLQPLKLLEAVLEACVGGWVVGREHHRSPALGEGVTRMLRLGGLDPVAAKAIDDLLEARDATQGVLQSRPRPGVDDAAVDAGGLVDHLMQVRGLVVERAIGGADVETKLPEIGGRPSCLDGRVDTGDAGAGGDAPREVEAIADEQFAMKLHPTFYVRIRCAEVLLCSLVAGVNMRPEFALAFRVGGIHRIMFLS